MNILENVKLPSLLRTIQSSVVIIAIGSFIISYNNLHQSALLAGVPPLLAWVFPVVIDAFLFACTGTLLYVGGKTSVKSRYTGYEAWAFLIIYTIASIAFNVHMAPRDVWSQAGFAMCPIGLCVALHILMRILEVDHEQCGLVSTTSIQQVIIESPCLDDNQINVLKCYTDNAGVSYAEIQRSTNLSYGQVKCIEAQLIALKLIRT